MVQPETKGLANEFYTSEKIRKYDANKRIIQIQHKMTQKCYELIDKPSGIILDIGCGSGHSIQALEENIDIFSVGLDINRDMLKTCIEKEIDAQYLNIDIGNGLPFQPASFDGIISVSCIQWLFYASDTQTVKTRIYKFFESMYFILKREAKACLQFYYEAKWQIDILMDVCRRVGFYGGVVIDGEGKNRKYYLVLELKKSRNKFDRVTEEIFNRKKTKKNTSKICNKEINSNISKDTKNEHSQESADVIMNDKLLRNTRHKAYIYKKDNFENIKKNKKRKEKYSLKSKKRKRQ